ncbi:ABC transporter substrate-binding protein [Dactylosporangium sp. CS-047395]|uniref:branched-chain amino acid ABC transporter substrate-binding protein n=1 Tax=Dactylosporangium sp. CS-047395 TaxID=3239936 RepID=UPI003D94EB97
MEMPDGRLPESFGEAAFPELKPFEIPSPAKPVEPPPAAPLPKSASLPAPPPKASARPARTSPQQKRGPQQKAAKQPAQARRGAAQPPGPPPLVPVLKAQPGGKGKGATAAWVTIAAVVVVTLICCAVARNSGDDDDDAGAPAPPARVVESTAPAGCPAIGFLGAAELGTDALRARQAVQLAVKTYNRTSRCSVRLVEADTKHAAPSDVTAALNQFGREVLGVVGPLRNVDVGQAGFWFDERELPFITPSAGDPIAATFGVKTFHRLYPTDLDAADAAATLLASRLKTTKVFVVRHTFDTDKRIADRLARTGGPVQVVGTAEVEVAPSSWAPVVDRIRSLGAESVYFTGFAGEAGIFAKALRAAGFAGPMVGTEALLDPEYATVAGPAGANTFATCGCGDPLDASFAAAFRAEFKEEPGRRAALAYDAATLLLNAIGDGARDRAAVQTALARGPFYLSQGAYRFTTTGDLDRDDVVVNVFRPDTSATTKPGMLPVAALHLT